ncbi:hypothetical protein TNCT_623011 [Trichonephila clavata]|uniref:Uncharacterized protein n=1 Tax=Trichonephila clavata TaxID=2740835 RepID=A0A8X6KZL0_TRICU|nr:hypothetical protein TNCT_623011 [Trichonephila clavata]
MARRRYMPVDELLRNLERMRDFYSSAEAYINLLDEANSNPSDETNSNPSDETNSNPSDETNSNPSDETNSNPSDETNSNPSDETNSNPSDETNSNLSDEANLNSVSTELITDIVENFHKVRWIINGYSTIPINTIIDGPTIRKAFNNLCQLRIDFQKKDNELHLILRLESGFYLNAQTKITICDSNGKKLYEEDFGPSYIFRKDETQHLIIPTFQRLKNLTEDTLFIYLSIIFRVVSTTIMH